ncbi:MAG TPA: C4-dicarboxylate ABC transporter [Bacteroidetes bacterium]|nr:C4-dicarboxylate ABC transporter [Bacteroidota bacterium]
MKKECRIKNFPVSFFSVILGLAGFTIALQKAELILNIPINLSYLFGTITMVLFILISIIYLVKIFKFNDDVKEEFNHPIKLSFFPTFSISLLLLSIAYLSANPILSKYLWVFGTVIHLIFTIKILTIYIQHTKFEIKHMSPAWFIPPVGNILVPVAGVNHFSPEISWFFFSIGLFFWIILLVIFFNRIIFHEPLAEKLLPTLFILIAPPAVGFISFVKLTGEINTFSKILYYFSLFLVLLLSAQLNMFKKIKFFLSWWAYSFPTAAITIASTLMYHKTNISIFKYISMLNLGVLSLVVILLVIKTGVAISRKEVCIEED